MRAREDFPDIRLVLAPSLSLSLDFSRAGARAEKARRSEEGSRGSRVLPSKEGAIRPRKKEMNTAGSRWHSEAFRGISAGLDLGEPGGFRSKSVNSGNRDPRGRGHPGKPRNPDARPNEDGRRIKSRSAKAPGVSGELDSARECERIARFRPICSFVRAAVSLHEKR